VSRRTSQESDWACSRTSSPGLSRVALLYTAQVAYEPDLMNVEQSAKALGLSIARFEVSTPTEFDRTFADMKSAGSQAVYISLSGFANLHRRKFADLALRHRLPAIFGFREFVEDGGLISYGASNSDGYRRTAHFVDKILKGTPPSALYITRRRADEVRVAIQDHCCRTRYRHSPHPVGASGRRGP
jgi:putative tryptophan/tyrosine transport system substrate-binding protein